MAVIDLAKGTNNAPSLDAADFPSVECPKCGCKLWNISYVIKKIPGVLVGQADQKDVNIPIREFPVLTCAKCGELAPFIKSDKEFMKEFDELTSGKKQKHDKGKDLIIK